MFLANTRMSDHAAVFVVLRKPENVSLQSLSSLLAQMAGRKVLSINEAPNTNDVTVVFNGEGMTINCIWYTSDG